MKVFDENARKIVMILQNYGGEAYFVGGCVRDMYMNRTPHDIDLTTNLTPQNVLSILNQNHIQTYDKGIQYGTVVAKICNEEFEVTTYRSDGEYADGRHPDNLKFQTRIEDDLARRDFTINAIAYSPVNNRIIDPYEGLQDIKKHVIRAVGNPDKRFQEDALRILRAIRFSISLGFVIDRETSDAIHKNVFLLKSLSKERITAELQKILCCGQPIRDKFMEYSDVITTIIPNLSPCVRFEHKSKYHKHDVYDHILHVVDNCHTDDFTIKLAALLHDIGKPDSMSIGDDGYRHFYGHPKISANITRKVLSDNLSLKAKDRNMVIDLVENHAICILPSKKSVKKALNKYGEEFIRKWIVLRSADRDDHIYPKGTDKNFCTDINGILQTMDDILATETCFSLKDLAVNGTDLMQTFDD